MLKPQFSIGQLLTATLLAALAAAIMSQASQAAGVLSFLAFAGAPSLLWHVSGYVAWRSPGVQWRLVLAGCVAWCVGTVAQLVWKSASLRDGLAATMATSAFVCICWLPQLLLVADRLDGRRRQRNSPESHPLADSVTVPDPDRKR